MDGRFRINQPINPVRQNQQKSNVKNNEKSKENQKPFQEIFENKIKDKNEIKFSKHAKQRISSRDIKLGEKEFEKLLSGLEKASDKGSKDSLIMVDEVAYVVSIENKTVITAIDDENVKENVFTNIDSAVFM
ncbi:MAG: TIGR02530 family flagellar biosynthesis protein [Bacillota bacterium]